MVATATAAAAAAAACHSSVVQIDVIVHASHRKIVWKQSTNRHAVQFNVVSAIIDDWIRATMANIFTVWQWMLSSWLDLCCDEGPYVVRRASMRCSSIKVSDSACIKGEE